MSDSPNESLKGLLAMGMLAVAAFMLLFTFTKGFIGGMLIPRGIPVFGGVKFGLIFLIFQLGYCYYFDLKKGFLLMAICLLISMPVALSAPWAGTFARNWLIAASWLSAIGLGVGVLHRRL